MFLKAGVGEFGSFELIIIVEILDSLWQMRLQNSGSGPKAEVEDELLKWCV